jgi:AraC-like DNA-binding protein
MADCMRGVTVAAAVVADMVGYLRAHGVDGDAVCQRAGITLAAAASDTNRVPGDAMAAMWRESIAATGDVDLGLHTGVAFLPGALDIVGYVMLSSHTATEALRRGARLVRLLNDGLAVDIERGPTTTVCRARLVAEHGGALYAEPRQMIEVLLVGMVHQVRLLTERPLVPLSVSLRHAKPVTGDREHTRLFGVMPRFSADEDAVVINNADIDVPLRSANTQLLHAFERHADAALTALDVDATIAGRALRQIVAQLKGELPTIVMIAKELNMSARHLQRGLAHEGTTFQTLLDDARRELAVRHLAAPDATVAKVAWLVGFSEPSAFHRAFRRWTGHSPRAARMTPA